MRATDFFAPRLLAIEQATTLVVSSGVTAINKSHLSTLASRGMSNDIG